METASDPYFAVRVLLSITTFGCSIIPMLADFNKTHATNPLWTGHARYHVVWQCLSYGWLGLFSFYLIWLHEGGSSTPLYISAFLCAAIYGGFFMTLMCIRLFDGKTHDENGYLPTEINLAGKTFFLDANVTVFSTMVALLAIALYLLPEL